MKRSKIITTTILTGVALLSQLPAEAQTGLKSVPVLRASTTMVGQPLEFVKTDKPEVTSSILTIEPKGETGLHMHPASSHVFIMEGELTIVVEGKEYHFTQGQAYLESRNVLHNAMNKNDKPLKLLVVTFGEEGKANVVRP